MLKFIIYEDDEEYVNGYTEVINKMMINYNYDYRILKFSKLTKKLKDEIANNSNEKIYILHVEMPDMSGLELASKIRNNDWKSIIMFSTGYSQYKNDVFCMRLYALNYIVKNYDYKTTLMETLNDALKALRKNDLLIYTFIYVVYRIPVKDIIYIEKAALGKKNYIVTLDGGEYEIAGSMNSLQERLGDRFYRSHKSCLVNLDNIKSINYSENTITFINDEEIDLLSVRCKRGIKQVCKK